jgi:hypothetical protein
MATKATPKMLIQKSFKPPAKPAKFPYARRS